MGADQLDGREQLPEALERVVLALDRDEHAVSRGQGIDGEQAERGRAVEQHGVVRRREWPQGSSETSFAALDGHELDLSAGEVSGGRDDGQTLGCGRHDAILGVAAVHQDRMDGPLDGDAGEAQTARRVGLRVEVHDEGPAAGQGEVAGEIDHRRGLAHAAFLVGAGDDLAHLPGLSVRVHGGSILACLGSLRLRWVLAPAPTSMARRAYRSLRGPLCGPWSRRGVSRGTLR